MYHGEMRTRVLASKRKDEGNKERIHTCEDILYKSSDQQSSHPVC